MRLTIAQLVAAGIGATQARQYVEPLNEACQYADIDTPARVAAFLAQCAHESRSFTQLEEGLYYRSPERIKLMFPGSVPTLEIAQRLVGRPEALANCVYANRLGNGDAASGDGWRYRGRGLIQLTGRAHYMAAGDALAQPYKSEPERVARPRDACLTAAWFWLTKGLNVLADSAQIDAITRAVNGRAMAGAAERRQMFDEAARAFA
jgi:putative chitinase